MTPWEEMDAIQKRITRGFREVHERMDEMEETARDEHAALRKEMTKRFDEVDGAHAAAKVDNDKTAKWVKVATAVATLITALSLIVMPIVLVLIGGVPK